MEREIGIINSRLPGLPGLSAYELAVQKGYIGTLDEWLLSLKGQQGLKGDQGIKGDQGERGEEGLTVYELAVANGYSGTLNDWLSQFDNDVILNIAKTGLVQFRSIWNTRLESDNSSDYNQIKLPLINTGSYDFTVYWGDGESNQITDWLSSDIIHTYDEPGIYTVTIEGELIGFRFNNTGDKSKILTIEQWGDLKLGTTQGNYFYGCTELKILAKDRLNLQGTTNLNNCFKDCFKLISTPQMSYWDVKNVLTMESMFENCLNFNTDLSTWDITNVQTLNYFLYNAHKFSVENYSELLIEWSKTNLNGNVVMHSSSKYNDLATLSRQSIINNSNWTIIDGGLN